MRTAPARARWTQHPDREPAARPAFGPGPAPATRGSAALPRSAPWDEPCFPPGKIAAVVDAVAPLGLAASAVLAGTGLQPDQLRDPDTRTSTAQLYRVVSAAAALCPAPDLGWRIGQRLRITSYGLYGYALLCAPTLRAVLDQAIRNHVLANPLVPIALDETDQAVVWVLPQRADLGLPGLDERTYRLLIVMQMAIHHTLARDVMGADCLPARAGFAWPASPADAAAAQGFGCELRFGQPRNELHYPLRWLDRQPQMADPLSATQASRACARLVAELVDQRSMSHRVYAELMRSPGQFPGIEAIAEQLRMTGRTLRRHLQVEGTSYAELLSRVRRALAEDYLRSTRMSIEDIASALSYGDARTFRHAFVRWTGQPPSDFRRAA